MKNTALIGYSGFVGSNIKKYLNKNHKKKLFLINSKNINTLKKKNFNKIYFCALPATKWYANKFPDLDKKNILKIKEILKTVKCKHFILISTIDVNIKSEYYGRSRRLFEKFILKSFKNSQIIRLPGLFGKGLKKNVIFDLLNFNNLKNINSKDKFQWLDIKDFIKFLRKVEKIKEIKKITELYPEPLANSELIKLFNNIKIKKLNRKPINYNFIPKEGYLMSKNDIKKKIKKFIKIYKK